MHDANKEDKETAYTTGCRTCTAWRSVC